MGQIYASSDWHGCGAVEKEKAAVLRREEPVLGCLNGDGGVELDGKGVRGGVEGQAARADGDRPARERDLLRLRRSRAGDGDGVDAAGGVHGHGVSLLIGLVHILLLLTGR